MEIDKSGWSGDGAFTAALVAALASIPDVEAIRVEDSPASRGETGYLFLSNEIYVRFTERQRTVRGVLGLIPTLKRGIGGPLAVAVVFVFNAVWGVAAAYALAAMGAARR